MLRQLASEPTCGTAIVKSGALGALVKMSGSKDRRTKRNCFLALCTLLCSQSVRSFPEQAGHVDAAINSLIVLVTDIQKSLAGRIAAIRGTSFLVVVLIELKHDTLTHDT